jgi:hypothetical protein
VTAGERVAFLFNCQLFTAHLLCTAYRRARERAMHDPYFDPPETTDELVTVSTYDDAVSASVALNYVKEAGLHAVLADANTVTMDWLLSNAIGGIKLQVSPKDAETAARLIEEHERISAAQATATAAFAGEPAEAINVHEAAVESLAALPTAADIDESPNDSDEPDLAEEPPPSQRERDSLRALRGALLAILFPPLALYVLYVVIKVYVSEEPLAPRYRHLAYAAGIINMTVLVGAYCILRSML